MEFNELLENVMDSDWEYATVSESYDEDEISTLINKLTDINVIGEQLDYNIVYDDCDLDTILDNIFQINLL